MQLSEHFSLEEFTRSQTAIDAGIDNSVPASFMPALKNTAANMERVRDILKTPITVNSAWRCPALNKAVGGKTTSQHQKGEAVDFVSAKFGTPRKIYDTLKASDLDYDQLILEFGRWVHISFKLNGKNRRQAFEV